MDKWIKTVESLLKANDGVDMEHASTSALYRAVSSATMAEIADTWQKCKEAPRKSRRVTSILPTTINRCMYSFPM